MKGIQPHTHTQRQEKLDNLIPIIINKYGDNLIALATEGSFSRNADTKYSDLEFIIFLKKIPKNQPLITHTIVDGLLIVTEITTKEMLINNYLDVSDFWYASGFYKLTPIINKPFIDVIANFKPRNIEKKCHYQIQKRWYQYQEITAKVLNNLDTQDKYALAMSFPQMIKELLIVMSFLNLTPYITLGSYITQAKRFTTKPKKFDDLVKIQVAGDYSDHAKIDTLTRQVFSSLEKILLSKRISLYPKTS